MAHSDIEDEVPGAMFPAAMEDPGSIPGLFVMNRPAVRPNNAISWKNSAAISPALPSRTNGCLTRFHGVFAPNCKLREHIVPRRQPTAKAPDKPLAPMTWMQRLKRVFSIDIETCPKCGGKLRVIACIEDPDIIARILEHIRTRDESQPSQPRAPPTRCEHLDAPNQDRLF